jgi:hypothetical protein
MLLSSLILNLAAWVWLFFQIGPQEDQIFLHYNILFGVDLIGEWSRVFLVPLFGLFLILFNAAIGWIFFSNNKFISQVFNAVALLSQIFIFMDASIVILLNI